MQLTLQVRKDIAMDLHQLHPVEPESKELLSILSKSESELKPMHPNVNDQNLAAYFFAIVPDSIDAEKVISKLQSNKAVEAVYFKPRDEAP